MPEETAILTPMSDNQLWQQSSTSDARTNFEKLIRIDEKLLGLLREVGELKSGVVNRIDLLEKAGVLAFAASTANAKELKDHEDRLRLVEKLEWRWIGGMVVLQAVGSGVVVLVLHLLRF